MGRAAGDGCWDPAEGECVRLGRLVGKIEGERRWECVVVHGRLVGGVGRLMRMGMLTRIGWYRR